MHDYDVGAIALSVPPTSAVITSYRPAVLVRNNGVHEAYASGYLRIYAADLLIFETELYSAGIAPGATGLALATDYWTPPAEGKYMIFGAVTCPLDQYEPNDHFGPVTIDVTGLPPPTPPPVTPHAAQHEEGGPDEVSIDGLKGLTADLQVPRPHAAGHQAAGADQLNVGALLGELAQDQPTKTHSNTKHDPTFATSSQLSQHQGATYVHTAAANLANLETSGPLTGHVPSAQIQLGTASPEDPEDDPDAMGLRFNRDMGYVNPTHHAYKHQSGGADEVIPDLRYATSAGGSISGPAGSGTLISLALDASWNNASLRTLALATAALNLAPATGATLTIALKAGGTLLASVTLDVSASALLDATIDAGLSQPTPDNLRPYLIVHTFNAATGAHRMSIPAVLSDIPYPAGTWSLNLVATFAAANAASTFAWQFAHHQSLGRKTT